MVCSLLRTRVTLQASDRAGDLSMDFKFNPKSTEVKEVIQQARNCFKKNNIKVAAPSELFTTVQEIDYRYVDLIIERKRGDEIANILFKVEAEL
jgi:hypothetical protein